MFTSGVSLLVVALVLGRLVDRHLIPERHEDLVDFFTAILAFVGIIFVAIALVRFAIGLFP